VAFCVPYLYTGQVVPVLKYYTIKTYGGVKVKLHAFVTSVVDGDEW